MGPLASIETYLAVWQAIQVIRELIVADRLEIPESIRRGVHQNLGGTPPITGKEPVTSTVNPVDDLVVSPGSFRAGQMRRNQIATPHGPSDARDVMDHWLRLGN